MTLRNVANRAGALLLTLLSLTVLAPSAAADPGTAPELVPFTGARTLTATWGAPSGGYHPYPAIDIALPMGSPVYAAGAGTVVASYGGCPAVGGLSASCGPEGLGNSVRIAHANGQQTRYGHLTSVVIASGPVAAGQLIGYSGSSGVSSGPHLHYQETNGASYGAAVDPGVWVACHGGTRVELGGLQGRVNQAVRNDGYGCAAGPSGPRPDGSLVRLPNGDIFRIVGGAPLHISRCDYSGGCAGLLQVPNLDGYAPYPRDGSLVSNVDDGGIYRFAGGAPLWISSCDYAPGCGGGAPTVDGATFAAHDHMRAHPVDGTLIANQADGGIYRFAGGAPLWISSCEYAPGCGGAVTVVDAGTFAHDGAISGPRRMRPYPADGTLIANHADGGIYRFAGGAPLWISSCDYAPGCPSVTRVDSGTLSTNGAISGQPRMRSHPADGTLVSNRADGGIYRFAGGAPLWISSCEYPPRCDAGVTDLDGGTFERNGAISGAPRMREVPADGTDLVNASTGVRLRVAGGAPLALSDCAALLVACTEPVPIDSGTVDRLGAISGAPRLLRVPRDGTLLRTRPSGANWQITAGRRAPASDARTAVEVNDSSVSGFPRQTSTGDAGPPSGKAPADGPAPPSGAPGDLSGAGGATSKAPSRCARARGRLARHKTRLKASRADVRAARTRRARRRARRGARGSLRAVRVARSRVRSACR